MISAHGITLDQEAALYHEFLRDLKIENPLTTSSPPRRKTMTRSSSVIPFQERVVCYRCGSIGHIATSCTMPLPTLEELEMEQQKEVEYIVKQLQATGEYATDEYGLYSKKSVSNIDRDSNWTNQSFCINCGEEGHVFNECRRPKFADLLKLIGTENSYRNLARARKTEAIFNSVWR